MVVSRFDDSIRLITQGDHAALAARLLSLWLHHGVAEHPRRAELLEATRDHDLGWQGADAAPALDPSGQPYSVFDLPSPHRLEIWSETLDRVQDRGWVGVLVREHTRRLMIHHALTTPDWADLQSRLAEHQAAALETAAGATGRPLRLLETELSEDADLLQTADTLSLLACGAPSARPSRHVTVQNTTRGLELTPFPLIGPTTVRVPARHIPNRPYRNLADIVGALGSARWVQVAVQLVPASGTG